MPVCVCVHFLQHLISPFKLTDSYVQAEETVSSQTVSVRESYATEKSRLERIGGTKPFLFQYKQLHLELKYLPPWSHDQVLRYLRCSLMEWASHWRKNHSKPKSQSPKHTGWWEGETVFLAVTQKPYPRRGVGCNFYMPTSSLWKRPKEQIEFH